MKKWIALLLTLALICSFASPALALTLNCDCSFGGYKHVFIIGVDGAGTYFEKDYMTNFHRIFENGAVGHSQRRFLFQDRGGKRYCFGRAGTHVPVVPLHFQLCTQRNAGR